MPPDLLHRTSIQGCQNVGNAVQTQQRLAADESKDGDTLSVECEREVKLTVKLNIRHAQTLTLRNSVWLVSNAACS